MKEKNMNQFEISCCSTIDLTKEWADRNQVHVAFFHYYVNGREHREDFFESIKPGELYQKMRDGAETKTSQVNVSEFIDLFQPILSAGRDILHISLSSGISGVFNSANIAAETLRDEYPDRTIEVVDSLSASSGYGMLAQIAVDCRDRGMSLEETKQELERVRTRIWHIFTTSDLTYLIRGGRVSKAAGTVGMLLNICPIMDVDREGKLRVVEKVRGRHKALKRIVDMMEKNADGGIDYNQYCFLMHADNDEDTEILRQMIEERFPKLKGKVRTFLVGMTIGCHTGPGLVAAVFLGQERT